MRNLKQSGRRSTIVPRHLASISLAAIAAVSLTWALDGVPFEGLDGNLIREGEGATDWDVFQGTGELRVGVDLPTGQADDSFQGKEDYLSPDVTFGSIPNNKSDLLRFYVVHESIEVNGSDDDLLYVSWVRANTLGTANMDFEFNQSDRLSANGVTPERTPGDMLITFAFSSGGSEVNLGLSTWTDVGPCEASNSGPCWGPIMPLTGVAEGSVNGGDVFDPIEGVTLDERTFGEAVVNLTAAGVFDRDACTSFGSAHVKSRSSDSFTSSMKDFIRPIEVAVSNCATITIAKNAVPDDDQDFRFDPSFELHPTPFDLDDDGDETDELPARVTFEARLEAPVTVAEQATEGWDLSALDCSGPAAPQRDAAGQLTGEVVITATSGESVDCTFTNTKRGRLIVEQRTDPDGDPQVFEFSVSGGSPAFEAAFGLDSLSAPWDSGAMRPGSYAVAQTDPGALWDLASAACDDGSPVQAVTIDPGETVTCTFLNVKRGAILVDEVTIPAGDPQIFDFALTGGPDGVSQSFALSDGTTAHDSGPLLSGSYDVSQTLPAGWDLTSAVCDDGSPITSVVVAPGETVVCTLTNTKRGSILVDQVTVPAGDPQTFGFDLTGGPDAVNQTFGLTDAAEPHSSGAVRPGGYDVTQTLPDGWDQTSAACSDGSPVDAVALAPGETVTCTFVNTKRGSIVVDQVTVPAGDPQTFDFDLSGGPDAVEQGFGLTDAAEPHSSGAVRPGGYDVTQTLPDGWDLTSAACSDGSPVDAVALAPGETVTCTFVNTKRGSIVVDQVTVPAGDPQTFGFDLTGGPDAVNQTFGLTDAAEPHSSGAVRPGGYDVTQTLPDGWDLTSAACSDGSPVDAVALAPGETVTCTFVNTKRGNIIVDEITLPAGDPQTFDFALTGGPDSVEQGFGLTDTSTPRDSGGLRPGGYAIVQSPAPGWDLAGAVCSDGSVPADVTLDPGESVTCTFTNVKRGTILVDVVTEPAGAPDRFDFTLTGGPDSVSQSFDLDDTAAPRGSGLLRPGSYAIGVQDPGEMWVLTSAVCGGESAPASIELDPGETVDCTFTFVKRAILTVVKQSVPDDPQDFDFSITGTDYDGRAYSGGCTLDDDGDPTTGMPDSHTMLLAHGGYAVVESDPGPAWDPTSVSCSSDLSGTTGTMDLTARTAAVVLAAGEHVTCVFVDTKRGRILVEKFVENESLGSGFDPRDYPFRFDPSWSDSFWLRHAEAQQSDWLPAGGTYSVTESKPNGWEVESVCVHPDGSTDEGGASIGVDLEPGAELHCTFYNVMRLHPGSSGFWKNWRNHYDDDQFLAILAELYGSPVYAGLFDSSGQLIPDAIAIVDRIYRNGDASLNQRALFELTTTMLNLAVSKSEDPAVRALQKNDDICLDCRLDLSDTAGAETLLEAFAGCFSFAEPVIGDVIDAAEATWTGDLTTSAWGFAGLDPFRKGVLFNLLEGINHGWNLIVDPRTYPDDPGCLRLEGRTRTPTTWYRDDDGDGFGDPAASFESCTAAPPQGHVDAAGDCDDARVEVNPASAETCDGLDNDCDGTVDSGVDGDVDGVDDLCDAYPNDPTLSGPLHVGNVGEVEDRWVAVALPTVYQDPIVIAGPPSFNDSAPGVVQLRMDPALPDSFEMRFAEWSYLDGLHAPESVPFLVLERGRHTMEDGSIWESGRFPLSSALPRFKSRGFEGGPFAGTPALFLTAQLADGPPVVLRARNVGSDGFEVALFQEEARMNDAVEFEVGYLAIFSPVGSGSIDGGAGPHPYLLQQPEVDPRFGPVLGWSLRLEEERSKDDELAHAATSVATLALGGHLFAQDVATIGWDTAALRRRDPDPTVAMEWGVVSNVDGTLETVPLIKDYTDPIVIVKPVSSLGGMPGVVRLRDVTQDSFRMRFRQWSYLACCGAPESVFYMVAEAGSHELAGLTVEVGRTVLFNSLDLSGFAPIAFPAAFETTPALFTSLQTSTARAPVTARISGLDTAGFSAAMQEEEAADQMHSAETLGWIAIEPGSGTTASGRQVDVLMAQVGSEPSMIGPGRSSSGRFPSVLADVVSTYDSDACTLRHLGVYPNGVELFIEEEQSLDAEMDHGMEDVSIFFAE